MIPTCVEIFRITHGIRGHSSQIQVGADGGTRTPDPLVRSQMLYPAELRLRSLVTLIVFSEIMLHVF